MAALSRITEEGKSSGSIDVCTDRSIDREIRIRVEKEILDIDLS